MYQTTCLPILNKNRKDLKALFQNSHKTNSKPYLLVTLRGKRLKALFLLSSLGEFIHWVNIASCNVTISQNNICVAVYLGAIRYDLLCRWLYQHYDNLPVVKIMILLLYSTPQVIFQSYKLQAKGFKMLVDIVP